MSRATQPSEQTPQGRDAVRRALITSAGRLWTERGLSVSVREIAREAGVNHGLVHRHFGGRRGLIRAVLNEALDESARLIDEAAAEAGFSAVFRAFIDHPTYSKLALQLLLEGEDPLDYQDRFPFFDWMQANAPAAEGEAELDARMRAALFNAAGMAWQIGEEHFLRIARLEGDPEELRRRLIRVVSDWLEVPPGLDPPGDAKEGNS